MLGEEVSSKVWRAGLLEEPWPHLCVADIFQESDYQQLLANLPKPGEMERLNLKMSTRYLYWLWRKDGMVPTISPFWKEFCAALFPSLRAVLETRFGAHGYMSAELLHDYPGYRIGPHTDTANKVITGLIYLPATADTAKLGTTLYRGKMPDPSGKGHKLGSDFEPVKVVPYLPNSALFFQRTDWSYHGVETSTAERWLLAFDLFMEK